MSCSHGAAVGQRRRRAPRAAGSRGRRRGRRSPARRCRGRRSMPPLALAASMISARRSWRSAMRLRSSAATSGSWRAATNASSSSPGPWLAARSGCCARPGGCRRCGGCPPSGPEAVVGEERVELAGGGGVDGRGEQLGLAAVAAVDGPGGDAGPAGDLGHAGARRSPARRTPRWPPRAGARRADRRRRAGVGVTGGHRRRDGHRRDDNGRYRARRQGRAPGARRSSHRHRPSRPTHGRVPRVRCGSRPHATGRSGPTQGRTTVKQRPWSRAADPALAAFALVLASCASSDSDGGSRRRRRAAAAARPPPPARARPARRRPAEPSAATASADGAGKKVGMVFDIGGKDDKSFNESAFNGLEAAAENMGVEAKELEPNADGSNREDAPAPARRRRLRPRSSASASTSPRPCPAVAADFPDTKFAIVDARRSRPTTSPRSSSPRSRARTWSAPPPPQATKTGKIGFVGGVETELIKKFQAGFEAGVAEAVNPDVKVEVKYITPDGTSPASTTRPRARPSPPASTTPAPTWSTTPPAAPARGVFEAAAAADRLAIGVDSDQYLQVDEAAAEVHPHLDAQAGRRRRVRHHRGASSNGDVQGRRRGLRPRERRHRLRHRTAARSTTQDQLDELKQQIIDGEIEVPTAP